MKISVFGLLVLFLNELHVSKVGAIRSFVYLFVCT